MSIVNKYRIKSGITMEDILKELKEKRLPLSEGGTFVHKNSVWLTWFTLRDDIECEIAFPEDLFSWNSYDYIIILDDAIGQPYYPFYRAAEDESKRLPYALACIGEYNKKMDQFNFLERI